MNVRQLESYVARLWARNVMGENLHSTIADHVESRLAYARSVEHRLDRERR